jgi:hypothetical protein
MREKYLSSVWYAKPNDLIGGWCVMPVNAAPGESNVPEVADFTFREHAEHIAVLHNNWLKERHG